MASGNFRPMSPSARRDPGAESGADAVADDVLADDLAALDAVSRRAPEIIARLRQL